MRVVLLAALLSLSCAEPARRPAAAPAKGPAVRQTPPSGDSRTIAPGANAPAPTEPGFVHCCGAGRFKLEMDCSERLMRCYEYRAGRWVQTYGRHCKRALDQDCYLHACDRRCDSE